MNKLFFCLLLSSIFLLLCLNNNVECKSSRRNRDDYHASQARKQAERDRQNAAKIAKIAESAARINSLSNAILVFISEHYNSLQTNCTVSNSNNTFNPILCSHGKSNLTTTDVICPREGFFCPSDYHCIGTTSMHMLCSVTQSPFSNLIIHKEDIIHYPSSKW